MKKNNYIYFFVLILSLYMIQSKSLTAQSNTVNQNKIICNHPYDDCGIIPNECIICNSGELDGLQFTMQGDNDTEYPTMCIGAGVINNPNFIAFVAWNTSMTLEICPTNCQGVPGGFIGVQAAIYENCPIGPEKALACNSDCQEDCFTLYSNQFKIGQTYYLLVDGCAGDVCDIMINCVSGCSAPQLNPVTNISGPKVLCPGASGTWNVSPLPVGATFFTWTLDGNPVGSTDSKFTQVFTEVGKYMICADGYNNCIPSIDPPSEFCIEVEVKKIPDTYLPEKKICADSVFNFNGTAISGVNGDEDYCFNIHTVPLMCDSMVKFHVSIVPTKTQNLGKITRCAGDYFSIGDSEYHDCGLYQVIVLQAQAPYCDSIIDFELDYYDFTSNLSAYVKKDKFGNESLYLLPSIMDANNCNGFINTQEYFEFGIYFQGKDDSVKTLIFTDVKNDKPIRVTDPKEGVYCIQIKNKSPLPTFECKNESCLQLFGSFKKFTGDQNIDVRHLASLFTCYTDEIKRIQVYDMNGKLIWQGKDAESLKEALYAYPSGSYPCIIERKDKITDRLNIIHSK